MAPGVYIIEHGNVDSAVREFVARTLTDVYQIERPEYVEVHIYETRGHVKLPVHNDIVVNAEYEGGLFHEAWAGYPRIHVIVEDIVNVEGSTRRAMLVHEAAHSILHGSQEYYVVALCEYNDLRSVHVAYTVVKDLEVHLWMASRGFMQELGRLRDYFDDGVVGCGTIEDVSNEARRLTVYIALGGHPEMRCGKISRVLYNLLKRVARCKPRPWACRNEVLDVIDAIGG
ncbi:hypothetical protein [Pyrolobus fumarii]|nr:hypothetical protein [Pyrolobus fumarii]